VADAEKLVQRCDGRQFFAKRIHGPYQPPGPLHVGDWI
jgi:hypothetical protein